MSADGIKTGITETERNITGAQKQEIHSIQSFMQTACLKFLYFWPTYMYLTLAMPGNKLVELYLLVKDQMFIVTHHIPLFLNVPIVEGTVMPCWTS